MFLHWYVDICTISYPFSPHFGMFHISDALCLQPWSNKTLRCSRCIMHGRKWHNCTWICLLVYCFLFFHNFFPGASCWRGRPDGRERSLWWWLVVLCASYEQRQELASEEVSGQFPDAGQTAAQMRVRQKVQFAEGNNCAATRARGQFCI